MDPEQLIARLRAAGIKHELIAEALGRSRTVAVQVLHGRRPLKAHEMPALERLLVEHDAAEVDGGGYLPIEVLPTYAGMGGGGTGEGERETALLPRELIEFELRGNPRDFLLMEARGESMQPKFQHGDQLLVDKRDRDIGQPGAFALRVADSYMLKNIELARTGLRVFSSNTEFADELFTVDELEVVGRVVWFARVLS